MDLAWWPLQHTAHCIGPSDQPQTNEDYHISGLYKKCSCMSVPCANVCFCCHPQLHVYVGNLRSVAKCRHWIEQWNSWRLAFSWQCFPLQETQENMNPIMFFIETRYEVESLCQLWKILTKIWQKHQQQRKFSLALGGAETTEQKRPANTAEHNHLSRVVLGGIVCHRKCPMSTLPCGVFVLRNKTCLSHEHIFVHCLCFAQTKETWICIFDVFVFIVMCCCTKVAFCNTWHFVWL